MSAPTLAVPSRRRRGRRAVAAAALLGLLAWLPACGDAGPGPGDSGPPEGAAPSPSPSVEVGRTVDFRLNAGTYHAGTEADGWYAPRFDLYVPERPDDGAALAVVVMFHGAPGVLEKASLHSVAEAVAARGAVVMVANWGNNRYLQDPDPRVARDTGLMSLDAAACAVSHAVALAPGLGGDPERLAVLGSSAGATPASIMALREVEPFEGCASREPFAIDVMVLWEGDWFLGTQIWDRFGDGLPMVMEAYTPWSAIGSGRQPVAVLVTTPGGRRLEKRCDAVPGEGWVAQRDPDGWFADRLAEVGAFDDGCLDVLEPTLVLAATLREAGVEVHEPEIAASGHTSLRAGDLEAVVDTLFDALDGPSSGG